MLSQPTIKISVLTPTFREAGLDLPQQGLASQTFNDFEWIVVSECPDKHQDYNCTLIPAPPKTKFSNLNASLNEGLRHCRGELVVMLQDYICPNEDGLQKFWDFYQEHKNAMITSPIGKSNGTGYVWDWRHYGEQRQLENAVMWEADWAAAPLLMFKELGGYDEEYDNGWSWDNANLAFRASLAGYEAWVLPDNEAWAFDHDAAMAHPFREKPNADFHNEKIQRIKMDEAPLRLNYL